MGSAVVTGGHRGTGAPWRGTKGEGVLALLLFDSLEDIKVSRAIQVKVLGFKYQSHQLLVRLW